MTDGRGKKKKAERKIRSDRKKTDRQRERERERERRDEEREKRRESGESDQCRSSDIRKRIEEDTKYDDDECKQTGMGKKETMRMIPHEDHELPLVSTSIIYVLVTITTTYCP